MPYLLLKCSLQIQHHFFHTRAVIVRSRRPPILRRHHTGFSVGSCTHTWVKDYGTRPRNVSKGLLHHRNQRLLRSECAVVQNLWLPCPCEAPFQEKMNEKSHQRCSWLIDAQEHRLVVYSSSMTAKDLCSWDSGAKSGQLSHSCWRDSRFFLKNARRLADVVNKKSAFSFTWTLSPQQDRSINLWCLAEKKWSHLRAGWQK